MKRLNGLSLVVALMSCVASFAASAQAPTSYRLTQIWKRLLDPGHENDEFEVTDINDKGQISGYRIDSPTTTGAFIWRNGQFENVNPAADAHFSWAFGINDWSEVAGFYVTLTSDGSQGYFWRNGRAVPVAPNGEPAQVIHLNNRRQVVLRSETSGVNYIWRRGQLTPLGSSFLAQRINDRGAVVGTSSSGGSSVPVVWQDGTLMPLGLPQGVTSASGADINDHNTVLVNASGGVPHVWNDGQYTALPVLAGAAGTLSLSINNSGVAVGSTSIPQSGDKATVWYGQQVADLNTLVRANDPLKPHVRLEWALLVNDRGEIVARGMDLRDFEAERPAVNHYLLTPID
jgi:uncharacterized membrane protein